MPPELHRLLSQVPSAVTVLVTVVIALLMSSLAKRVIARLGHGGHLPALMVGRLQTIRRAFIWTVACLVVLQATGLFAQAWAFASALLAALAVGFFAVWSVLSNSTSSFIIMAIRPFRIGDHIQIMELDGNGLGGQVVDMNLMYTELRERATEGQPAATLRVPNNLLLQKVIRVVERPEPKTEPDMPFFPPPDDRVG